MNVIKLNQKGLSLTEILVCLFIISLLAIQLLTVFLTCGNWIANAKRETIISHISFSVLETVRADQDINWELHHVEQMISSELSAGLAIPEGVTAKLLVEPTAYLNLYQVKIIVDWPDEQIEKSMVMQTYIRRIHVDE